MRKRKIIRGAFYTNTGETSAFLAGNMTLSSLTNDWWVTYLKGTNYWKIAPTGTTNATTEPILIDSTTTSIIVTPSGVTLQTGYTQQLAVINQDSLNVLFECTFSSSDEDVATVNSSGLITTLISGTTTIITLHNDGPSGTTSVTVKSPTTEIFVTPETLTTFSQGTTQQLTIVNQDGTDVLADCIFSRNNTDWSITDGGLATAEYIGTTIITATHIDGPTDTFTGTYSF